MHINGEVPKLALIESDAPDDIMNREIKYMMYLLIFLTLTYIHKFIFCKYLNLSILTSD